jgi:hypothetical protein
VTGIVRLALLVLVTIGILCAPPPARAQQSRPAMRAIAFFGRVESVDPARKVVTVKHGKISGYADSGTTEYSTDADEDLKRLQPGDNIRATVYPNDLTLHKIQIVYRPPDGKAKTSK